MSDVEELVKREPWRLGSGQPENALDPTWTQQRAVRCNGAVQQEGGTGWWFCKKCGCCGRHDFAKAHRPINDPAVYLAQSVEDFFRKREASGVSRELALQQMLHVAGVAIRYAATVPVDGIGDYVEQLIVR